MRGIAYVAALAAAMPCFAGSYLVDTYDEFTDERILEVTVTSKRRGLLSGDDMLHFWCRTGRPGMGLKPGSLRFHMGDTVDVRVRFDDLPYEDSVFDYARSTAVKFNGERELRAAASSARMIARVGNADTMRFDLWSAREDLAEFEKRCAAWGQHASVKPKESGVGMPKGDVPLRTATRP